MLSGLCTYDDILARMADVGFATASDDELVNKEIITRKIAQAENDITMDLIKKVQKIISPYLTDGFNNTPAQIVDKITAEAIAYLNQCAIFYTIQGIYEEGYSRLRFPGQEAPEELGKILKRWDLLCQDEFESICPLLTFDQDGNGSVTLMERLLMQKVSSIRVTA